MPKGPTRGTTRKAKLADLGRIAPARAALLAKLERMRAERRARRNKRLGVIGLIVAALLMLLLVRCSCDEVVPVLQATPTPGEVRSPTPTPGSRKVPGVRRREKGAVEAWRRPDLSLDPDAREVWFDRFRTQVATRSAEAARCFPGEPRFVLRWDLDLRSRDGVASRSTYTVASGLPEVSADAAACLDQALASKAYALGPLGRDVVRVSIVIEF